MKQSKTSASPAFQIGVPFLPRARHGNVGVRHQFNSNSSSCPKVISTKTATPKRRAATTMNVYDVEIELNGEKHLIPIHEEQTFLEGIESYGMEVLHSCRAGVCVTCAAKLIEGEIDPGFAAITDDLKDDGYVLTCSAYPRSDGIKLQMNKFDDAYKRQYGQYELEAPTQ